MSWNAVITDAGRDLFGNYIQGGLTLSAGAVKTGTGGNPSATAAEMRARTSLVTEKVGGDGMVESIKRVQDEGSTYGTQFRMRVGASNVGLYTMNEIGLYINATDGTTTSSTMVAYFVETGSGIDIPLFSSFPDFAYILSATLAIDNVIEIELTVDPEAFISHTFFEEKMDEVDSDIGEKLDKNCGSGNSTKFMTVNQSGEIVPLNVFMTGATEQANGLPGLPPAPTSAQREYFLRGDATWGVPNDTTYTAGTGLSLTNGQFSLSSTGATAGSYGPSADVSGTEGTTMNVPYITVDAQGRITGISNKIYTSKNTTYSASTGLSLSGTAFSLGTSGVTAGTYGPSANVTGSNGATISVPQITVDKYGRVTGVTNRTYTSVNTNTTYSAGNGLSLSGTTFTMSGSYSGTFTATKVVGAVWNDYAECREVETTDGGYCVTETSGGKMAKSSKRLMPACRLTSDTYGICIGETAEAKAPVAVSGRVLAYPYNGRKRFHVGDAVCSAPGGTVDVMSRREIRRYPDRIVGIVSEIPEYTEWKCGSPKDQKTVNVNGRVWIYVR